MADSRKLFCEISPFTYQLSVAKCKALRHLQNICSFQKFAAEKSADSLPVLVCAHNSLIRRRLGNVDMRLQENKATNLSLAAPKVCSVLIRPGELFSFWKLVGPCTQKRGYQEGLTISSGKTASDIGGGMCQFTNLIHWMVLHSPLRITEHHHHDGVDLFPDFGRQIPFGTGTSVLYNYLDYRFQNTTDITFQLITYVTDHYLCGELRASREMGIKYHIKVQNEFFSRENGVVFRNNEIFRECVDTRTGELCSRELLRKNHARVMYDPANLVVRDLK